MSAKEIILRTLISDDCVFKIGSTFNMIGGPITRILKYIWSYT